MHLQSNIIMDLENFWMCIVYCSFIHLLSPLRSIVLTDVFCPAVTLHTCHLVLNICSHPFYTFNFTAYFLRSYKEDLQLSIELLRTRAHPPKCEAADAMPHFFFLWFSWLLFQEIILQKLLSLLFITSFRHNLLIEVTLSLNLIVITAQGPGDKSISPWCVYSLIVSRQSWSIDTRPRPCERSAHLSPNNVDFLGQWLWRPEPHYRLE